MRALLCASVIALTVGCGDAHRATPEDGSTGTDAGGQRLDGGSSPDDDGGPIVTPDGGPIVTPDGGPPPIDAGAPEGCDSPGATETVPCGSCGTVQRFCTATGEWAYGVCMGEGECVPGTIDDVSCGDCGTQAARCTASCVWEPMGTCTGEGECTPGESVRTGVGCPSGEQRDLTCNTSCMFVEESACSAAACPTPGAVENVQCGMCGERERFCTASHTWDDSAACTGEGVCMPGTTGSVPCGMCGTQPTRCTTACAWEPFGACTGEGVCEPGTMTRTADGCPPGETRLVSCNATCGYTTVEPCEAMIPVDVMLLLDVTGSNAARVETHRTLFATSLIRPLIALGDVAVGIAYYADFPISGYGTTSDVPFEGGIEPLRTAASVEAELGSSPRRFGSDTPESGIEALSILTGGTPPASALPMTCSLGRDAGGCWRPGAERVIILYTDAPQHNGPDPLSSGLYRPYAGITPAPATWPTVSASLIATGTELIVLAAPGLDTRAQHAAMISDLGQPAANLIDAPEASLGVAFTAAVARVRAIGGY